LPRSCLTAALEKDIEKASDPRKLQNTLGVLYSRYGQNGRARKEFEKLVAQEEYVPVLLNLGNVLYLSGQKEGAGLGQRRVV
jgi:Flp pilus assembly protein TadD